MSVGARAASNTSLAELLSQKERDLELAAKIGQSLLEQNKELQARNEFLEENLSANTETVVQLKYELHKRIELLRVYSHYDDDGFPRDDSEDSLRRRLERLHKENAQLKCESSSLRKLAEAYAEKERKQANELARQLDTANERICCLQQQIFEKNEDCAAQTAAVERLLKEIGGKCGRERELMAENEELNRQLDDAVQRQEMLQVEINDLQERYTELRGMFYEAEEELVRFRQQPSPFRTGSIDSLYDSLASELENSDSGFSGTPAMSSRNEGLNLRLELQKMTEKNSGASPSKEEVDVPSTVLAEVARKKIAIEPTAPPQTPQSETVPTPTENLKNEEFTRKITCDASTSTYAEISEIESLVTNTSTTWPTVQSKLFKENGGLRFSSPQSTPCSPLTPIRLRGKQLSRLSRQMSDSPSVDSPLIKYSSNDSLENYVAPKMGEPGMPGTRDLDFSLKMLKTRRQVEQDYAQFLKRKGLPPSTFFSEEFPPVKFPSNSESNTRTDNTFNLGQDHQRTANFCRIGMGVGLEIVHDVQMQGQGQGVLTRAELGSPSSSPRLLPPAFSNGLVPIISCFSHNSSDIFSRSKGVFLRPGL